MPDFEDDKSPICIPFILDRIKAHRENSDAPFFVGLNGVQGAGKTTLVAALEQTLTNPPHSLSTVTLSIDDLYLTHDDQQALAESFPSNPLLQHRGQPKTHDLTLGTELFKALQNKDPNIEIPAYDKSAFNGQGDRALKREWRTVNRDGDGKIEVVLFEGWCVGFRALSDDELEKRWRDAKEAAERGEQDGQLWKLRLEDVQVVNEALKEYDAFTDRFDAMIHIDAEDTKYVYDWRLEAEDKMRRSKGTGMTDEQVINFVNGYYPAYELFSDRLRTGIFKGEQGRQLRFIVGRDRKVKATKII